MQILSFAVLFRLDGVAKTLDARLRYTAGEVWLAAGFSAEPAGKMIGSEVVLGLPSLNEVDSVCFS